MNLVKIIIYKTKTGKEPITQWIMALDRTARAIVTTRLKRVNLGNFGDCKILKQVPGVWELRIDYGPGYRIYFGKQSNVVVILLIGGDKHSQEKDIKKALECWLDYKESVQ